MSKRIERLEEAEKKGYLAETNRKDDIDVHNAWYAYCKKNNLPFTVILHKRNYSDVSVDLITTNWNLNTEGEQTIESYLRMLMAEGTYHWGKMFGLSKILVSMEVKKEKSEDVLKRFVEIMTEKDNIDILSDRNDINKW